MSYTDWVRATLGIMSAFVALGLLIMALWYIKRLSYGQILYAFGAIFVLIYVADALREAASIGLEYRWRLIPLTLGLICYFIYLLEPRRRKIKRFGGEIFDDHKGQ